MAIKHKNKRQNSGLGRVKPRGKKPVKPVGSSMSNFYKKWDPTQPLRGKGAQREVNAATNLEFDPQKRALARSMAGSDVRQGQIDKWYGEYQNQVAQLRGETNQGYANANAQIGQFSQNVGQMDAANRQNIEDAGRRDAAMRGTDYSPQGAIDATNAANARQQLLAARQAQIAGQGANANAYANRTSAAVSQQGVEQHTAEAGRKAMLQSDAQDLAKKEGDFRVDFLRQLREDERKYQIESAAARVDRFKARTSRMSAKETGRHNRSTEANTVRGQNLTRKSSKEGHQVTAQGQKSQNIRDQKNRRQRGKTAAENARHHRATEKASGSGKKGKKGKI